MNRTWAEARIIGVEDWTSLALPGKWGRKTSRRPCRVRGRMWGWQPYYDDIWPQVSTTLDIMKDNRSLTILRVDILVLLLWIIVWTLQSPDWFKCNTAAELWVTSTSFTVHPNCLSSAAFLMGAVICSATLLSHMISCHRWWWWSLPPNIWFWSVKAMPKERKHFVCISYYSYWHGWRKKEAKEEGEESSEIYFPDQVYRLLEQDNNE